MGIHPTHWGIVTVLDWFQTIGAVLGIIATLMIVAIQFQQVSAILQKLIRFIYSIPKRTGIMINDVREWRWARSLLPDWEIIKIGELTITRLDNDFRLELPIEITFKSRDDRYLTTLDCHSMIDLHHKGRGRDRHPYRMISPTQIISLQCGESKPVNYTFSRVENGRPLLVDEASFNRLHIATVELVHIRKKYQLSTKVRIKISNIKWEEENVKT